MDPVPSILEPPSISNKTKNIDLLFEAKKLKIYWKPDLEYNCLDHRYSSWETGARISQDRLTFTGTKHWSTSLTRGCADSGKWYFECTINQPDKNWKTFKVRGWDGNYKAVEDLIEEFPDLRKALQPSVRIGFGTRLARLESPIGDNPFGCAIIQDSGGVINNGIVKESDICDGLNVGDVIGCAISLNEPKSVLPDPRGNVHLWPFLRKGLLTDVSNQNSTSEAKILNEGSFFQVSVNGQWSKNTMNNLYCVEYHPGVSTFMGGSVTINLGPNFVHSPPDVSFRNALEMESSRYPCKEDLIKFWLLGDTSVLSTDAIIVRGYTETANGI